MKVPPVLQHFLNYFLALGGDGQAESVLGRISLALIRIAFAGYVVCAIWFDQIYIMNYNLFLLIGIAGIIVIGIEGTMEGLEEQD